MSDQNSRDDGTRNGPGEQILPKKGGKGRDPGSLGSGRVGGRPTEDDLAKREGKDGASAHGGEK